MTIARAAALVVLFGSIALVVVCLRAEQMRSAARIQQLEAERTHLRRMSWALQMEIARRKAPEQITDRVEQLRLQVAAPYRNRFERWDAGLADSR